MSASKGELSAYVDVRGLEITLGGRTFKLVASDRSWRTTDPTSGEAYWFRPVERPFGEGWWFVGEPAEARYLCCLWCSACGEAQIDPRPHRRGKTSGTFEKTNEPDVRPASKER